MRRDFFLLFALCVLLFAVNNTFSPPDIMESRNLVSAREMVASGDWLVPTLNGAPRLEKPPLPTWGAAVMECLFPASVTAQRALAALMAWLEVWFAYLLVHTWLRSRRRALMAAAILASTFSLMFMARNATWDIWAQAFCLGGMWLYVRSTLRSGPQYAGFVGAGLLFGLSFMSKGPVALYGLLLPFLIAFHAVERPSMRGKWGGVALMLFVAIIVGAWWYAYLYFFVPDKMAAVMHKETTAWAHHNVRPWHYYKWFFVESGLWCFFWLCALIDGWRFRHNHSLRTALVWSLAALVLLSLMPEKKTRYLLPMMVPCALSVAFYLRALADDHFRSLRDRRMVGANVTLVVVLLFVLSGGLLYFAFARADMPILLALPMVVAFVAIAYMLSRELMGRYFGIERIVTCYVCIMLTVSVFGIGTVAGLLVNPAYRGFEPLRTDARLSALPYVWPEGENLRPEVMRSARKLISVVPLADTARLQSTAPFVLLSVADTCSLPASLQVQSLGHYDLNWSKPRRKHRHNDLNVKAWLVSARQ